jgi:hypothetical protein
VETSSKKQLTANFEAHRLCRFVERTMDGEKKYFECMSCGRESELASAPPKCTHCGSGSGVISPHSRVQKEMSQDAFRRAASMAKGKMS